MGVGIRWYSSGTQPQVWTTAVAYNQILKNFLSPQSLWLRLPSAALASDKMASSSDKMACVHWRVAILLTLTLCQSPLLAYGTETNTSLSDPSSEALDDLSNTGNFQYSEALWPPMQQNSKLQSQASQLVTHDADSGRRDGGNLLDVDENKQPQEGLYDKRQNSISVSKRSTNDISNWGSNPYLLGKRFSNRAFWTARGKKDVKDMTMNPTSERDNPAYNMRDFTYYDSLADPYDNYAAATSYWDGDVLEEENQDEMNENLRRLNMVRGTVKLRDRPFWAASGNRQRTEANDDSYNAETYPEKRSPRGLNSQIQKALWKSNGGDSSKFWMSRGRRFWPARGKKAVKPAIFSRLARLVNSGYRESAYNLLDTIGQRELEPEHVLGYQELPAASSEISEQPIFWVVRGKKTEPSTTDDFNASDESRMESSWDLPSQVNDREKKAFNDFASALSRLKGREYKVPNFWANRGRKNFWAARGKRAMSNLNG
ncbi:hypothetical protein FHG87_010007 [Trinorchestia longiramus]|nr:hypothetical protein FHG87_010007 [Trinorchestia longiramus]